MLLDLFSFFFPQPHVGGDDAGGWKKIKEKPVLVKRNTIREALKLVIDGPEKIEVPASITVEVKSGTKAPSVDWQALQNDFARVQEILVIANQILLQQQEEDDEEALMVLI